MRKVDAARILCDESPFDLFDGSTCAMLEGLKTEMRWWQIYGSPYVDICDAIDSVRALTSRYVKDGRFLDLRPFFVYDVAQLEIARRMTQNLDFEQASDEELRDALTRIANNPKMEKHMQLLIGFPAYVPKCNWNTIMDKARHSNSDDYSYEETIKNMDIVDVRDVLKWIKMHI